MESSLHIPPKNRVRGNKRESKKEKILTIFNAQYIGGSKVLVDFSNMKQRIIDFEPLFVKYVSGYYNKFLLPLNFKKFVVDNGNIFWGKNEVVIFPVSLLYNSRYGKTQREEVLYVL